MATTYDLLIHEISHCIQHALTDLNEEVDVDIKSAIYTLAHALSLIEEYYKDRPNKEKI